MDTTVPPEVRGLFDNPDKAMSTHIPEKCSNCWSIPVKCPACNERGLCLKDDVCALCGATPERTDREARVNKAVDFIEKDCGLIFGGGFGRLARNMLVVLFNRKPSALPALEALVKALKEASPYPR